MVPIKGMAHPIFRPTRRALLAGLGAAALGRTSALPAFEGRSQTLRAQTGSLVLRVGKPDIPVWSLAGDQLKLKGDDGGKNAVTSNLAFRKGDHAGITIENRLPAPLALTWRGIDGNSAIEPLLSHAPAVAGASDRFEFRLRHAGTYLCDLALLGDGAALPTRPLPLIVHESESVSVDRDELLLIEGFRLRPDGTAIAPGIDPAGSEAVYTLNGELMPEIRLRRGERIRIRLINGLQRNVIAVKIERHQAMVMALDGQPAEPFLARNGAVALAPGARADLFVDAMDKAGGASIQLHDGEAAQAIARLVTTDEAPIRNDPLPPPSALPSNGLPPRLDLKTALRADLVFASDQANWLRPLAFAISSAPAFKARLGRTVVLSLINRAVTSVVFHLHGHHFRLLDRLDDGWKPFWLDTIAIEAGQTQRIAFAAEHAGRWLIEAAETRWEAPLLVRWYNVE